MCAFGNAVLLTANTLMQHIRSNPEKRLIRDSALHHSVLLQILPSASRFVIPYSPIFRFTQ